MSIDTDGASVRFAHSLCPPVIFTLSGMNSRRVHQFMREHFPALGTAGKTWTNVADIDGPRLAEIGSLLSEYVGPTGTIVEVHRKLGTALPAAEAASFIGSHIGEGEIRATNRECTGFVVVAINGVACGWHAR
jgi:hypothetical protein